MAPTTPRKTDETKPAEPEAAATPAPSPAVPSVTSPAPAPAAAAPAPAPAAAAPSAAPGTPTKAPREPKVQNVYFNDCFSIFRALCMLSMKELPETYVIRP